jgi:transcriptional regulator NrdR family protein
VLVHRDKELEGSLRRPLFFLMYCPNGCKEPTKTKVKESRKYEFYVRRIRYCVNCGTVFTTIEKRTSEGRKVGNADIP